MTQDKDIKPMHEGHRDRMRARIENGEISALQPHEILEYVLFHFIPRKNTNDIAHDLINRFGSFQSVLNAEVERLEEVKGMTHNAAVFLHAMPDVLRAYIASSASPKKTLKGRGDFKTHLTAQLYGKPIEEVYVVGVDGGDALIKTQKLSSGDGRSVSVYVREIVDFALRTKSVGIVMAHNHPGGKYKPSQEDIEMTREILWSLDSVGVTLMDHLIFAGRESFSFEEAGLLSRMYDERVSSLKEGMFYYDID